MFGYQRFSKLVCCVALLPITGQIRAGDPKIETTRLTVKECEQLIEKLVNPGKSPFKDGWGWNLPVTVGTLRKSQEPIQKAYDQLSDNIEVSLPVLMKHFNDNRFSYVYEVPINSAYHTRTVGDACRKIIQDHVEVYHKDTALRYDVGRTKALWFIDGECGGPEKWWNSRKSKSLAQLQLEGIEWALEQPKPDWFESEMKWEVAKSELNKMALKLRESGKPILIEHHVHFFSY